MPTKIMDQGPLSSFSQHSEASAYSCDELHVAKGRQLMSGSKSVSPPFGFSSSLLSGQKNVSILGHDLTSPLRMASTNTIPRPAVHVSGSRADLLALPGHFLGDGNARDLSGSHYENGLFSSSFSDMFDKKMRLSSNDVPLGRSVNSVNLNFGGDEPFKSMKEIEDQTIGNLLPDDDDLLSGVIDNVGRNDMDDDIFYNGGGIELEKDDNVNDNKASEFTGNESPSHQQSELSGPFFGKHPNVEHPSRTLFVRNINSNVEDAELRDLFEQYGDIRTLYTACKHRGFVMISYYDIRAACNAMQALQDNPLRRRKLDIHFSIPKDNPTEKDINQGALVVYNLDSSVTNDGLHQIFGVYGEIREIREALHKHHQKSIEFYDIRAAEAALHALDGSDVAGKKIKLHISHPGGVARQCLMQQSTQELEEKESKGFCHGSPNTSFPWSECFGSSSFGVNTSNNLHNGVLEDFKSSFRAPFIPRLEAKFHDISSSMAQNLPTPVKNASICNHASQAAHDDISHSLGQMNFGFHDMPAFHSHSLPDYHNGLQHGIPHNSSCMRATGVGVISRPAEVIDKRNLQRVGPGSFNIPTADPNEAFGGPANVSSSLHRHQHVWNNTNSFNDKSPNPMLWSTSPSFINKIPTHYPSQIHGIPKTQSHMLNTFLPLQHHVGSAPAVNPSLWDRRYAYTGDSTELHAFNPGSLGNMGHSPISQLQWLELASRNMFSHGGRNCMESSVSAPHMRIPSPQQRNPMFNGGNPIFPMPSSFEGPSERFRSRRSDINANQSDIKKQFELDIERIIRGEDSRTTLMIKNIPNKYTSKMMLAAIDENHRGTYDFIYLPIDFKNKCNVGYAFINMINPQHIIPFYQSFNGKKWEKFNSEKVASLAYARIQGKAALVAHFQNSSLMNEDKRCRPILFHTDGPNAGDQEPFPVCNNFKSRSGRSRTLCGSGDSHLGDDSSISANGEASFDAMVSPPGSTNDSE